MKRIQALLLAAVLLISAYALTGCGDQARQEGEEKTSVTIAVGGGPGSLDPYTDDTRSIQDIYRCIFEGLVKISSDGEIAPLLAESWEQIDDTTVRFHLREDVKFHNGEAFNAETVRYNVERIWDTDLNSIKTVKLAPLKTANVIDE